MELRLTQLPSRNHSAIQILSLLNFVHCQNEEKSLCSPSSNIFSIVGLTCLTAHQTVDLTRDPPTQDPVAKDKHFMLITFLACKVV